MSRLDVPFYLRHFPRFAVFSLIAVAAAGCAGSARFSSREAPPQDVTGSISSRPMYRSVETRSLPAPNQQASGAYGAPGLSAYRPQAQKTEVTGSVPARAAPSGHWTWDGGAPVTVMQGETVDTIAHRYGVPVSAILETNGFRSAEQIHPGQRLVIPHYVSASTREQAPAVAASASRAGERTHIVAPGETLMGISRKYNVALSELARANKIKPFTTVSIGERVVIPGGHRVAELQTPAPKLAPPRTVKPSEAVGSVSAENARLATPEPQVAAENPTKVAQAAGNLPSFRWPVHGRVIAGFGSKINGAANDGINVAVPEGTPIKAADDGVVAYAGNELKGYGNLVLVRHANGYVSAYANASELTVKRGDTVKRGQVIAHAGQTGNVSSPQLHFEIRKGSIPVDPMQFLGG